MTTVQIIGVLTRALIDVSAGVTVLCPDECQALREHAVRMAPKLSSIPMNKDGERQTIIICAELLQESARALFAQFGASA